MGAKTRKISLVNFLKFNFNIIFLATCGCESDFFKDATKFQNGRQKSTPKFFVGAKTSEIIQILQSHSPQYGDMQVIFLRFW